jgi:hypothetical protein
MHTSIASQEKGACIHPEPFPTKEYLDLGAKKEGEGDECVVARQRSRYGGGQPHPDDPDRDGGGVHQRRSASPASTASLNSSAANPPNWGRESSPSSPAAQSAATTRARDGDDGTQHRTST